MRYYVGFDPGGKKGFGWCTTEATGSEKLQIVKAGTVSNAQEAVKKVVEECGSDIAGLGIDSPLFYAAEGDREVDKAIRDEIKKRDKKGSLYRGSTVQQVNSLRGACLVQGILAAHLIRRCCKYRCLPITESHPKALLWLLCGKKAERFISKQSWPEELEEYISGNDYQNEHERDAALGAVSAWAMINQPAGWEDIFREKSDCYVPVPPVSYWMPMSVPGTVGKME